MLAKKIFLMKPPFNLMFNASTLTTSTTMPENCFSLTWGVVKWTEAILPDIGGLPACSLQEMDKRVRFDKILFKCKQLTVIK